MTSSTILSMPVPMPLPAGSTQFSLAEDLLTLLRTTTTESRPDEQLEALAWPSRQTCPYCSGASPASARRPH